MHTPRSGDSTGGLPLSAYYDQTLVREVAVAPGGDRVAFVAQEFDADEEESLSSLFVAPADGSREPHRLTRRSGASSPRWSPDGSKLGFLAGREADVALRAATTKAEDDEEPVDDEEADEDGEGDGGEDGQTDEAGEDAADEDGNGEEDEEDADEDDGGEEQQVWVFDLELGGDARQVTTRPDGVSAFDWSPDGDRLVVAARNPTPEQREYLDSREDGGPVEVERLLHKANGRGWLDEVRTYLFVVEVESREERRLDDAHADGAMFETFGDCFPAWGAGDRIAFVANRGPAPDDSRVLDVHTIDPDGSDLRRLTDGDVAAIRPTWSPDGDRLAFLAFDPGNDYVPIDLRVVGPDGAVESLSADLDRPVHGLAWTGDETVLAVVGDEGQSTLRGFDLDGSHRDAFPAQAPSSGLAGFDADPESGVAGLVVTGPNERDVYALDPDDAAGDAESEGGSGPVRLTRLNRDLLERSRVACERVRFESEPGVEVEGLAYHRPGADLDGNRHPVVVDVHGGPVAFDQPAYRFHTHHWVGEGYVVLNVNYRGSSSYGRAFSESIRGDWGPREAADVEAGVEHLVERGWVDPDRVFVTGFSYGAMTTAYVLARTDVATAGAAEHGVYDYYSAFGTDDSHLWWEHDFGLPWEEPEVYRRVSSITEVGRMDAPLLVTAGGDDWRCPPSQAEQLYVSLKKCGVDSKLVVYPEVPHNRGPPDFATHRLETVTDWFREHDPAIDDGEGDREVGGNGGEDEDDDEGDDEEGEDECDDEEGEADADGE